MLLPYFCIWRDCSVANTAYFATTWVKYSPWLPMTVAMSHPAVCYALPRWHERSMSRGAYSCSASGGLRLSFLLYLARWFGIVHVRSCSGDNPSSTVLQPYFCQYLLLLTCNLWHHLLSNWRSLAIHVISNSANSAIGTSRNVDLKSPSWLMPRITPRIGSCEALWTIRSKANTCCMAFSMIRSAGILSNMHCVPFTCDVMVSGTAIHSIIHSSQGPPVVWDTYFSRSDDRFRWKIDTPHFSGTNCLGLRS